jgi:hypothetical protein
MKTLMMFSVATLLAGSGCRTQSATPASSPVPVMASSLADPAPARRTGNPLSGLVPVADENAAFQGLVLRRLDAGPYSYLAVAVHPLDVRWVATMGEGVAPGHTVSVRGHGVQENFWSNRLEQRFDRVVFGQVEPVRFAARGDQIR